MERMEVTTGGRFEPGVLFKVYLIKKGGKHELQHEFFLEDHMIEEAYKLTKEKVDV